MVSDVCSETFWSEALFMLFMLDSLKASHRPDIKVIFLLIRSAFVKRLKDLRFK